MSKRSNEIQFQQVTVCLVFPVESSLKLCVILATYPQPETTRTGGICVNQGIGSRRENYQDTD